MGVSFLQFLTFVDGFAQDWFDRSLNEHGENMKNFLWMIILTASMSTQAATIAVIDSGVDTDHADLINNMWINAPHF